MNILVTEKNLDSVVSELEKGPLTCSLDTETTGLLEKHSLFSIIVHKEPYTYYFNFKQYLDTTVKKISPQIFYEKTKNLFSKKDSLWFMANAKFDLRMLKKENIFISGKIHDIQAIERVINNDVQSTREYSLNSLATKYFGKSKDDSVLKFIDENELWDIENFGNQTYVHKRFQDVPFEIIMPYACLDAKLTYDIGMAQLEYFEKWDAENKNHISQTPLLVNEQNLTKALFKCEREAIFVSRKSIQESITNDKAEIVALEQEFLKITGFEFYDGPLRLSEVFNKFQIPIPKTEKGNPSFSKESLSKTKHRVVEILERIRWLSKRISTYYYPLLYYSDTKGMIHADIQQHGARSGRLSCVKPNLTNIPAEEEDDPLRAHFIPRKDGNIFVSLDYKQQELRMLYDRAGENKMIKAINEGFDPHQYVADMVKITRKQGKTLNFALVYGIGLDELAKQLEVSVQEAKEIREKLFSNLQATEKYLKRVISVGKKTLCVTNWFGRICKVSESKFAYKLPNYDIQGGCADVVKKAINEIYAYELKEKIKSPGLLFPVHDELVCEFEKDDFHHIAVFKKIMESCYPSKNGIKLEVDVSYSFKSWAQRDMIEGLPCDKILSQS